MCHYFIVLRKCKTYRYLDDKVKALNKNVTAMLRSRKFGKSEKAGKVIILNKTYQKTTGNIIRDVKLSL